MTSLTTRRAMLSVALALTFAAPLDLSAMPRATRRTCGEVVDFDPATRTLTIAPPGDAVTKLVLRDHARVIKDGKFTAETVGKGDRVCIWYRWPIFGPKAATRIFKATAATNSP